MHLLLPAETPQAVASSSVMLSSGPVVLWPADQPLKPLGDERIFGTLFLDAPLLQSELLGPLSEQAARQPATMRGAGGKKVRDAVTWNFPAMQLLMQRALLCFCRAHGVREAHVLDRWANVMRPGDYSTPHAHYDAASAVVYFLDPGETDPCEPMDGTFEIIDPRVPFCCPGEPERPLRGLTPVARAGLMLLFPAALLHHVRPYQGGRPRITLAWNISPGPPPSDRVIDPTQPVPMKTPSAALRAAQ
jgi:hypothetical protein